MFSVDDARELFKEFINTELNVDELLLKIEIMIRDRDQNHHDLYIDVWDNLKLKEYNKYFQIYELTTLGNEVLHSLEAKGFSVFSLNRYSYLRICW